jgi:hypothetical protein
VGYPSQLAVLEYRPYYDEIAFAARVDGKLGYSGKLMDPEPINGSDLFYTADVHLANTPRGVKLVQVDPEFVFHRADRGAPKLEHYEAETFGDATVRPVRPVSASASKVDLRLSTPTYVSDQNVPALHGAEKLNERD